MGEMQSNTVEGNGREVWNLVFTRVGDAEWCSRVWMSGLSAHGVRKADRPDTRVRYRTPEARKETELSA
jgi:hypothetical protein